jgi:hypothetical protein
MQRKFKIKKLNAGLHGKISNSETCSKIQTQGTYDRVD